MDAFYAKVLGIRILPNCAICEGTCQSSINTIEVKGVGLNPTRFYGVSEAHSSILYEYRN